MKNTILIILLITSGIVFCMTAFAFWKSRKPKPITLIIPTQNYGKISNWQELDESGKMISITTNSVTVREGDRVGIDREKKLLYVIPKEKK